MRLGRSDQVLRPDNTSLRIDLFIAQLLRRPLQEGDKERIFASTYRSQAFRLELPFPAVPRSGRDGNEAGILRMTVKLPLANDQRFSRVGGIGQGGAQAFHKMSRQGDRRNHPSPRSVEHPPTPMR